MSIPCFHNSARPPALVSEGETRKWNSIWRGSSSERTLASTFLVSDRKIISGEHFEDKSLSLWTVWGFPIPQQFQLKTTKEEEDGGCENPAGDFLIPMELGFVRFVSQEGS